MKICKKWGIIFILAATTLLLGSCATVHKHPRHHRHHPHRHKVVIIAEQPNAINPGDEGTTTATWLAMTKPDTYGSTE